MIAKHEYTPFTESYIALLVCNYNIQIRYSFQHGSHVYCLNCSVDLSGFVIFHACSCHASSGVEFRNMFRIINITYIIINVMSVGKLCCLVDAVLDVT